MKRTRKTLDEPKFHMQVGDKRLPTRGPLVGPCSRLHQYLRDLAPKLVGQGVNADWPKWDRATQSWLIEFGSDDDEFVYVKIRIYYDGSVRVVLLKRPADPDMPVKVAGTLNYPGSNDGLRARVQKAWDSIDNAAPKIAGHLLLAHKDVA